MQSMRSRAAGILKRVVSPFVSRRKTLPFLCWINDLAGNSEPELLRLRNLTDASGAAVDIGAAFGWYTYRLSKQFRRVFAFEVNDDVTKWIQQYNPGNIELIHCGLSSTAGTGTFYVPVSQGVPRPGWASFDRNNLPNADSYLEKQVRFAPLDDFNLEHIDFIKIDVEGHEWEVLKGAPRTVAASRPVVLIEVRASNQKDVDSWFAALKYRKYELQDLAGVSGQAGNYIYIPEERSPDSN